MILTISRMKTKRFVHISSFKSFLAKAPGGAFFVFFVELEVGKVGQAFIPWISGFSQWIRIHWEDSLMWIVDVLWHYGVCFVHLLPIRI